MSKVHYKNYEIEVWVEVFNPSNDNVIYYCESIKEAQDYLRAKCLSTYSIRWAAAEIINKCGDVNPSVKGITKKQALDKLKKVL